MRTYLINLKDNPERLENMRKQLEALPLLDVCRIDAVNGRKDKIDQSQLTTATRLMGSPGTIGCFLSHRKAWQQMVDENVETAIVMEDDCELSPAFYEKVLSIQEELAAVDWNMVYLGYVSVKGITPPINKFVDFYLTLMGAPTIGYHYDTPTLRSVDRVLSTVCYMLTKDTAAFLLKTLDKVDFHVDVAILRYHDKMRVFMVKDPLVYQGSTNKNSNICISPFPKYLNDLVANHRCESNISLTYYLTAPAAQIGPVHVNLWNLAFALAIVLVAKGGSNVVAVTFAVVMWVYFVFEVVNHINATSLLFVGASSLVLRSKLRKN
jgi:GR25 family glycosyltransferase involved in LPS biosynthesis